MSKSKSWTVGHKLTDAKESKIIPSSTESARFYQSVPVAPNIDFTSQKSEIGTERYYPAASYQQPRMGGVGHPVSSGTVLTLRYLNPLKGAVDDLRKAVAGIEGKVAEAGRNIDKSGADNFAVGRKVSDITHKTDINLNHLTDQVYQMLEKKIRIESERRGL